MADYISRKAVLDLIESAWAWGHSVNRVCDDLRNLPAADVVPAQTSKATKTASCPDLDDIIKRYTEECVALLGESVQKHLKDLLDENAKLKEENVALQRKAAFFCRMSLM